MTTLHPAKTSLRASASDCGWPQRFLAYTSTKNRSPWRARIRSRSRSASAVAFDIAWGGELALGARYKVLELSSLSVTAGGDAFGFLSPDDRGPSCYTSASSQCWARRWPCEFHSSHVACQRSPPERELLHRATRGCRVSFRGHDTELRELRRWISWVSGATVAT